MYPCNYLDRAAEHALSPRAQDSIGPVKALLSTESNKALDEVAESEEAV